MASSRPDAELLAELVHCNPQVQLDVGGRVFVTRAWTLLELSPVYRKKFSLATPRRTPKPFFSPDPPRTRPRTRDKVGSRSMSVAGDRATRRHADPHSMVAVRAIKAAGGLGRGRGGGGSDEEEDDDEEDTHSCPATPTFHMKTGLDVSSLNGLGVLLLEHTRQVDARMRLERAEAEGASDAEDSGEIEEVRVFVDRDGTHFRYILNFLRDGEVLLPPEPVLRHELLVEALFYGLKKLADVIRQSPIRPMCPYSPTGRQCELGKKCCAHGTGDIEDTYTRSVAAAEAERKLVARADRPMAVVPSGRPLKVPDGAESGRCEFTWEEIEKHNTVESCWLVVKGYVYDATPFLRIHPAGPDAILRHGGTDATRDFLFHSKAAQKAWSKYLIGRVQGEHNNCTVM